MTVVPVTSPVEPEIDLTTIAAGGSPLPPSTQTQEDWRDPRIADDIQSFVKSYYLLRDRGLSRTDAEDALARYLVETKYPNQGKERFDELFQGVPGETILREELGLRDPGWFGALAEGTMRGAIRGSAVGTGMLAGMRTGSAAGRATGIPYAPLVGGAAGALLGAGIGAFGGSLAEQAALPETNLVPGLFPFQEAGVTLGSGLGGLAPATAMMRDIPPSVGKVFENVAGLRWATRGLQISGEMARKEPVGYTLGQLPGALGAGAGAFGAELYDPGNFVSRLASETIANFLYPGRVVGAAAGAVSGETPGILGNLKFLRSSQESAASRAIITALAEFREDPQAILKILSDPPEVLRLPSGRDVALGATDPVELVARSPGLMALANAVSKRSPGMALEREEAFNKAERAYGSLINALSNYGSPEAIEAASELRANYAEGLITRLLQGPLERVQRVQELALGRLPPGGSPGDAAKTFGDRVFGAVSDSIDAWRNAEKQAYSDANLRGISGNASNIIAAWNRMRVDRLIPETEKEVPDIIKNFVARVSGETPSLEYDKMYRQTVARAEARARTISETMETVPSGPGVPSVQQDAEGWVETILPRPESLKNLTNEDLTTYKDLFQERLGALRGKYEDDEIPGNFPVAPSQVSKLLKQYVLGIDDELSARALRGRIERFAPEIQDVPLADIQKFRSEMLRQARDASSRGEYAKSSLYSEMAEAALDDLGVSDAALAALQASGAKLTPEQEKLREALAISRAGNKVFTQTFAGEVTEKDKTGALRTIPELLARKFVNTSDDKATLNFLQLENALLNAPGVTPSEAAARVGTVSTALDHLFREQASKYVKPTTVVNPATGREETVNLFDETGLQKFMADNAQMLDQPALRSLRNDLRDVSTANRALQYAQNRAGKLAKDVENEAWFSKYLANESPVTAFASALGDKKRPESRFRNLLQILAKEPTEQIPGPGGSNLERLRLATRDAVMGVAVQKATREDGTIDANLFRKTLFSPISPSGGPSVMDVLSEAKYGVVDKEFKDKLNLVLAHLDATKKQMEMRGMVNSTGFGENLAQEFAIRFLGANVGSSMSGGAPSLQTAAFGAQAFRRALEHIPTGKVQDLLVAAVSPTPEGRQLFQALLKRGIAQQPLTARGMVDPSVPLLERMVVRLVGAPIIAIPGVQTTLEQVVEPPLRKQPLIPPTPAQPASRTQAPEPRTEVQPPAAVQPSRPLPPIPPPSQSSVTSPEDRQRFAALFPGDIVSPMIRQTIL